MKKIKVFQLNDYEWWAGETLEEVKAHYLKETGMSEDEAFEDEHELSLKELRKMKYFEEDSPDAIQHFDDVLKKMIKENQKFPCFFATTEI